eukprot:9278272-Pyramimonas_sp.AAC.1
MALAENKCTRPSNAKPTGALAGGGPNLGAQAAAAAPRSAIGGEGRCAGPAPKVTPAKGHS